MRCERGASAPPLRIHCPGRRNSSGLSRLGVPPGVIVDLPQVPSPNGAMCFNISDLMPGGWAACWTKRWQQFSCSVLSQNRGIS